MRVLIEEAWKADLSYVPLKQLEEKAELFNFFEPPVIEPPFIRENLLLQTRPPRFNPRPPSTDPTPPPPENEQPNKKTPLSMETTQKDENSKAIANTSNAATVTTENPYVLFHIVIPLNF